MKKILSALILALTVSLCLTGCGLNTPRPDVKNGEFDVSVTYEVNGEVKTLDLVYICEYDGIGYTLEGTYYRAWNGHFKGYGDGDPIEVLKADDGSVIQLSFLIYAEYFMGEPEYIDDFYPDVKTERVYYVDGVEMIDYDQELIAEDYGVRVIGIKYAEPIENTFGLFL